MIRIMPPVAVAHPRTRKRQDQLPPLVAGDRLSRDAFERRYTAMPGVKKAELVEGIVYMPSPVKFKSHSMPHALLSGWLFNYLAKTPGLLGIGDNGTVRLDNDNEFQTDLFLLLPPHVGGKAKVDEDDYVTGPPALVCEISGSTVNIDLHAKKNAYRRNGVQEYVVWRIDDDALDWFVLVNGEYAPAQPDADGVVHSAAFPGLCLDPNHLLNADSAGLLATLEAGLRSDAHVQFLTRLAAGK